MSDQKLTMTEAELDVELRKAYIRGTNFDGRRHPPAQFFLRNPAPKHHISSHQIPTHFFPKNLSHKHFSFSLRNATIGVWKVR